MSNILLLLLLQLFFIALNAIFACAEIAIISANENKLEKAAEDGNKKASRLLKLKSEPSRFLSTIQVAITLSGFLGSAFAADNFSDMIVDWLLGLGVPIPANILNTISVIFITLVLSYFTIILGELVPKRLAMRRAESVALAMSTMISFISKLFAPIVFLLTVSTNGVLKLLGIDPSQEDNDVSEEDIKMMVDAGTKAGAIDDDEQAFIQNIFEFDDMTAADISTHRTEVVLLWGEESPEEWDKIIRESDHQMYPVCSESVDNIIGVLNSKEYFKLGTLDRATVMNKAISPAYFVPETVKADVLFRNMKRTKNFFAVVLDEYGGMAGIITMNNLVEQLVGELDAEDGSPETDDEIERVDVDGVPTWHIKGTALLSDVEKELDVDFSENEADTFGGFVFGEIGAVPEDGATFQVTAAGLIIDVLEVTDHQIVKASVRLEEKNNDAESEED